MGGRKKEGNENSYNHRKKIFTWYKAAHPNENHESIAELFQSGKSTVGDIFRTKEKWPPITEKRNAIVNVNGQPWLIEQTKQ